MANLAQRTGFQAHSLFQLKLGVNCKNKWSDIYLSASQMKMDLASALLEWELEQMPALRNWAYLSKQ